MNDIRKLQNYFNYGVKAKVFYQVNDRVHLKGTRINGIIQGVVFKKDRSFPYLKIQWDKTPDNPKEFYDPFDIVKEDSKRNNTKPVKKNYDNFYMRNHRV